MSARLSLLLAMACTSCGFAVDVLSDRPPGGLDDASATDGFVPDTPRDETGLGTASHLTAGQYHTCALVRGTLSCWGPNVNGQLGVGDSADHPTPARVMSRAAWTTLDAGEGQTCALVEPTGDLWCWGSNAFGQLGLGDTMVRRAPFQVAMPRKTKQISAGYRFTCAVMTDGTLWCFGENGEGQLGQGGGGSDPSSNAIQVGTATTWSFVSAGQGHACGIQAPGSLWCWGRNSGGELGLGPGSPTQLRSPTRVGTDEDWLSIDLGQDSACAIKKDGSLWCWGYNEFGGLGFPGPGTQRSPRRVGTRTDWIEVAVDTFSSCGRTADKALWCWGRNAEGQLGTGDITDRSEPTRIGTETDWAQVVVGRFHHCARKEDTSIWCTGANSEGQLGTGDGMRRRVFTRIAIP